MNRVRAIKKHILRLMLGLLGSLMCISLCVMRAKAATVDVTLDTGDAEGSSSALDLLFLLAILALIPSLLLVMTSFTRIIISLSFLRSAIGTQSSPPNQVLIGLALFLTIFIMFPTFTQIKEQAYDRYVSGEIGERDAISAAGRPLKEFMLKQVYNDDLDMFISLAEDKDIAAIDHEAIGQLDVIVETGVESPSQQTHVVLLQVLVDVLTWNLNEHCLLLLIVAFEDNGLEPRFVYLLCYVLPDLAETVVPEGFMTLLHQF